MGCGDARTAVGADRSSVRCAHARYGPQGGEPGREFDGVAEGAVRFDVADGGHADRAGDVAGYRVGRLGLPAVALPRPGVEQQSGPRRSLRARRVEHRQVTWFRGEVTGDRRRLGGGDGEAPWGRVGPGPVAAVEHSDVLVPEVAQQPPAAGGDRRVPVVVHHDRSVLMYARRAHRGLEGGRAGQRVPPRGTRRPGQVPVQVGEDRTREMPLPVAVDARRAAEPPPHVEEHGHRVACEFGGQRLDGDQQAVPAGPRGSEDHVVV